MAASPAFKRRRISFPIQLLTCPRPERRSRPLRGHGVSRKNRVERCNAHWKALRNCRMANGQSMARARLSRAAPHNAGRHPFFDGPSRADALEGFLLSSPPRRSQRSPPGFCRDGRPGSRLAACQRSAGPAGGNGASRLAVHRWRGERKVRFGGASSSRAPRRNSFCTLPRPAASGSRW